MQRLCFRGYPTEIHAKQLFLHVIYILSFKVFRRKAGDDRWLDGSRGAIRADVLAVESAIKAVHPNDHVLPVMETRAISANCSSVGT